MRLEISLLLFSICCFVFCMSASVPQQQQQIVQNPLGFKQRSAEQYDDDVEDYDAQAQTQIGYRSRLYDYAEEEQHQPEIQQHQHQQQQQQQRQQYQSNLARKQQVNNYSNSNNNKKESHKNILKQIEEELEDEEPDRLAILLEKSSFSCNGKTTGYYADDSISCEVFHYCQENQKHSWVCPEGFTFHQIHLICMPPSGENICEQSSKYHVVNEYLYKPLNLQEHQSKPNVTLRYSERYYPENFYDDGRYDEADDRISHNSREPIQVIVNTQQRKSPSTTASPYRFSSQQQHQQQQQTQQHTQQYYRSPEEINISLQQRRPTYYVASSSTPKYTTSPVDNDYGYEK